MVSLTLSSSRASSLRSASHRSLRLTSASPTPSTSGSASSSTVSLTMEDEENITITTNRALTFMSSKQGKQKSSEDLRFLAISTHMTELSYSISDIQTRIFEIQELRHKSQSSGDTGGTTGIIDQSLMNLDERLESVSKGLKSINDSLEPLLQSAPTPTLSQNGDMSENALILRKHATLTVEWRAVQDESEVLREELKEDKWLTVFRTVTGQADGMMSSLEKAVNRCQDFIWQVHRRGADDLSLSQLSLSTSHRSDKAPANLEMFASLLDSFEAKKKHYMPATSKVLSIIDKGVQDRVTKNGETLRRHAESAQRWRNLRERISRTDAEMEGVRKFLMGGDTPSENGSSTSGMSTRNGYLATPSSARSAQSRAPSTSSTISRSMSPFRKFARKITGTARTTAPVTPLVITKVSSRTPSSEPVPTLRHQKASIFSLRGSQPSTPVTPDRPRPGHKHSQSLTPDSSPRGPKQDANSVTKAKSNKQRWNSSTKVEQEERIATIKATPPRRPSAMGMYPQLEEEAPPVPLLGTPHRRSVSRSSIASSRPWSPVTSSASTATSSHPPLPTARPPSRAQTPSGTQITGLGTIPRSRPKTPSHIPGPAKWRSISGRQSDNGWDDDENTNVLAAPAFSPALSTSGPVFAPPPRPPSRSMIPVPSLQFSSASRPSSAMSQYRSESPADSSFRTIALRAQTPESALRARVQQVPFYQGSSRTVRQSLQKLPPSSFRDASVNRTPGPRPGSRAGAYTPTLEQNPVHQYIPSNAMDPLDVEVAAVVNSIAHGLLIERVDPPLRTAPREGEEIRAQYAFSNSLSRKVVTCRLTTMTRSGAKANGDTTTKKVMCRVGGGWQDLQLYMLNRQAGM